MSKSRLALWMCMLGGLAGCQGQKAVEHAECSVAEQDLFLACVDAGCSASYTEDLGATDACAVDGGGSIITVEAGASCGFTSSGSCYVLCTCPEGASVEVDVGDDPPSESSDLSVLESAVSAVEDVIGSLTEQQTEVDAEVAGLADRLAALEAAHAAELAALAAEVSALQVELDAARDEIAELDARTAGTVVVSQYDLYCTLSEGAYGEGFEWTRPVTLRGYTGTENQEHCVIAKIDPDQRPYLITAEVLVDNDLHRPPYSTADSLARYGVDDPTRYYVPNSFGNDLIYSRYTFVLGTGGSGWISASGDVILESGGFTAAGFNFIQADLSTPGVELQIDLPVRVTIFHDRPYTLPPWP